MKGAPFVTIIAASVAQSAVPFQAPNAPLCGSSDRDIGRGFTLTQHMFGGSPEFTLKFQPAPGAVTAHGVTMAGPFQLQFSERSFELPGANTSMIKPGPSIFFSSYELRQPDGTLASPDTLTLDCGSATVLHARYSASSLPDEYRGATITWAGTPPFSGQPERRCLDELRQHGRFKVSITQGDVEPPLVVISDHVPFGWALAEVERIWKAELVRAAEGQCRLPPPPPVPF